MKDINVPSYNSLLPGDRRVKAIQDLYDYISRWKPELDAMEATVPADASPTNQLATESSVATNSATFQGNYNLVTDLSLPTTATHSDIETALGTAITGADINDYCWVDIPTSSETPTQIAATERYKYNGTAWSYEYSPSPAFSSTQWDAINSGITSALVAAFGAKAEVGTAQDPKTANTVYGAKAYADDAVATESLFQKNLAAIMSLAVDPNAGVTIVTTNPEWKLVYTDAEDRILLGKRQDDTWYFADDLDTILDTIISGYRNVNREVQGFVDLGLPSGTLWATKNIGAETPEDYGYYFSWGNIEGHKPSGTTFSYDFGTGNSGPYANTIGSALTTDIPDDNDAALRYLGGNCKMPTTTQFAELVNTSYVTREFVRNYRGTGVSGLLITSKSNGNKLFLPAAGRAKGTSLEHSSNYAYYWSRNIYSSSSNAFDLNFTYEGAVSALNADLRYIGFPIRPVM